jgi:hypothetical protein
MVKIFDLESNQLLAELTDEEFQHLADILEEESLDDDDYYVNIADVEFLDESGKSPSLVAKLKGILGDREDREIKFVRAE